MSNGETQAVTLKAGSPAGNVNTSVTTTSAAIEGPLLRNEST
jgi:hypothetical protein